MEEITQQEKSILVALPLKIVAFPVTSNHLLHFVYVIVNNLR